MDCCPDDYRCTGKECANLAGIRLSKNAYETEPFLSLNSTWLSTHTSTSSAVSSTTSSLGTVSSTATSSYIGSVPSSTSAVAQPSTTATSTTSVPKGAYLNVGAIAGGTVGGFTVLALLVFGLFWLRRRRPHDTPKNVGAEPNSEAKVEGSYKRGLLPLCEERQYPNRELRGNSNDQTPASKRRQPKTSFSTVCHNNRHIRHLRRNTSAKQGVARARCTSFPEPRVGSWIAARDTIRTGRRKHQCKDYGPNQQECVGCCVRFRGGKSGMRRRGFASIMRKGRWKLKRRLKPWMSI